MYECCCQQTVDAYCDFEDHRTIVYHTFTDFMLFSVDTGQAVEKSKISELCGSD